MNRLHLDTLELDADIGSREGVSTDQLTRSRLQFALSQNATLQGQAQFADAKAATLLTLIGLLAAYVSGGGVGATTPTMAVLLALNAAVLCLCLIVLMPSLHTPSVRSKLAETDRFSWPALTCIRYTAEEHAAFLRCSQASQLILSVARSNASVARILMRKYLLLRIAFIVSIVNVGATLAAAALPQM
jgi:hypothetical protein